MERLRAEKSQVEFLRETPLKTPQDPPRWPKIVPRWSQDGPSWYQDGPRWSQDGPKMVQDGPGWSQDGFKMPKMAQDVLKMAQYGPKMVPRWPKIPPLTSNYIKQFAIQGKRRDEKHIKLACNQTRVVTRHGFVRIGPTMQHFLSRYPYDDIY